MVQEQSIDTLAQYGGDICFDFINTVNTRRKGVDFEYLSSYDTFLDWCEKTALCTTKQRRQLKKYAQQHSMEKAKSLESVIRLRETLYALFSEIASKQTVGETILHSFNTYLHTCFKQIEIKVQNGKFSLAYKKIDENLLFPTWPIIYAAYKMLLSDQLDRVKECYNCGWIFLDQTKNGQRKWCNPSTCGSVEKSRRYYERRKLMERNT